MLIVAIALLALFTFIYLLVRASRDPLTRVAECAVETGDDSELKALIGLLYGNGEE